MPEVTVRKSIDNPNLSAEDWDLYVGDKKTKVRVDRAAVAMNEKFTETVNGGMARDDVECAMHETMARFADTGAFDTEPRAVLSGLLDRVFGQE